MTNCKSFDERLDELRAMGPPDLEGRLRSSLHLQELCLKVECLNHYVHAVLVEADTYVKQGRYEDCLRRLHEVLPLAENKGDERAKVNTTKLMAEALINMGNLTDALELFFKILPLAERLEDRRLPASILLSMGGAYLALNKKDQSLTYSHRALQMFQDEKYEPGINAALTNIGYAHIAAENYGEAIEILTEALASAQRCQHSNGQVYALNLLGIIHRDQGRFHEAGRLHGRALQIARRANDSYAECDSLHYLAKHRLAAGKPAAAMRYCRLARDIAQDQSFKRLLCELYQVFALVYETMGKNSSALAYFRRYHELDREIVNAEAQRAGNSLRLHFENETAQKEAEIQRLRNVELADMNTRLDAANSQLVRSNAQLTRINAEKSLFMRVLRHELLSPLKHVIFYAEELDHGFDRFSNTEMLEIIRSVQRESSNSHSMVETLLNINLIELGELLIELESVEICACARDKLTTWAGRAKAKRIKLIPDIDSKNVYVSANRIHLQQIIDNLLSNAVKFSQYDTSVRLKVREQPGVARLEVQDEGPGLTNEDKKRVFQTFAKLSARPTGGEKSHGIGLSFVRRITEAMNGRVWCESEAGKGAVFIVELPLVNPA